MSVTVYFKNTSKRRNSTLQPSFSASDGYDCVLKDATSLDRPTFLVSAATMDFNVAKWGNRYYFIDDVVSVRNNQWEVSCVLDVLATYKTEILASTQYVSYSASHAGNATWLADTRIPVIKKSEVDSEYTDINTLFDSTGFFVLTVVGLNGCETFAVTAYDLTMLIANVSSWRTNLQNTIYNSIPAAPTGSATTQAAIDALAGFMKALNYASVQTDFLGNAYANAPACIRSCIWVPFLPAAFEQGNAKNIFLGEFDTGVSAKTVKTRPATGYKSLNIPWFHTDWRRSYCEEVYLYLPLVGMVQLSVDDITSASSVVIHYSATCSDGCVAYLIECDGEIIGTYGGNVSANQPIGINQQASVGEIANAFIAASDKIISTGVQQTLNPASATVAAAGSIFQTVTSGYEVANVQASTHVSCTGGIGGGAGSGLILTPMIYVVNHETIVEPVDMAATMGRPVMKPMSLSTCTGYTQCTNAHVSAAAQVQELDAIDYYLNSGFYIE